VSSLAWKRNYLNAQQRSQRLAVVVPVEDLLKLHLTMRHPMSSRYRLGLQSQSWLPHKFHKTSYLKKPHGH
jgi:hypothetical protein